MKVRGKKTLFVTLACFFSFCGSIFRNSIFLTCFFHHKRIIVVQFDSDAIVFLYTKYIFLVFFLYKTVSFAY